MGALEAIVAAVGGILVGAGASLLFGRGRERALREELKRTKLALRQSILPALEESADTLGVTRDSRGSTKSSDRLIESVETLGSAIRRHVVAQAEIGLSDTLELQKIELDDTVHQR